MVRYADIPEALRTYLDVLECKRYDTEPWIDGPPLRERRVVIVSTAGLQKRGDRPFGWGSTDYRVIPGDLDAADIVMSHVSTNYDRSGFQQDLNVIFPIDRLRELAHDGVIGSVADYHYSVMGASDPDDLAPTVRHLAPLMKKDDVDAAILVPV